MRRSFYLSGFAILLLSFFEIFPIACGNSPTSPVATPTPVFTPVSTSTFTPVISNTATNSPTITPSSTPTNTLTKTGTPTPSFTATNSPTLTQTFTPTNTVTNTVTSTPSPTTTNSPTPTPTTTPTLTLTGTLTPPATPTSVTSGSSWTLATSSPVSLSRSGLGALVFNGKMWIISGDYVNQLTVSPFTTTNIMLNDVWSSSDGTNWTQATASAAFPGRFGFASVVFNNEMWVIDGQSNSPVTHYTDAWYSSDGATWSAATTPPFGKDYSAAVSFNGNSWVIGGQGNYHSYYSADGSTWNQATTDPPFSNSPSTYRYLAQVLVYNNKMWFIGGLDGTVSRNDVWYSSDGTNWTQATAAAAFPARDSFTSTVYNNLMWVFGGITENGSTTYLNDAWYSSDGVTWTAATTSSGCGVRRGASVTFNSKMWIMCGQPSLTINSTSNIWWSQ